MRIRPITSNEIGTFAALTAFPDQHQATHDYLERMFQQRVLRPALCFLAEEANAVLGRLAYWLHPKTGMPTDIVLFDVPWERQAQSVGTTLVQQTLPVVRRLGAGAIGYVLDTPAQAPQWQNAPTQRRQLLLSLDFALVRETQRFAYDLTALPPAVPARLSFTSLRDVGIDAFVSAIEQVSIGTLDHTIQLQRARLGSMQAAHEMLAILQNMRYEPEWWQLAYTHDDVFVGLVMPTASVSSGTIGYIGVVPQQRGRGYSHDLLARGTAVLSLAGVAAIYADADVANAPMAKAFHQSGYTSLGTRQTYRLEQM